MEELAARVAGAAGIDETTATQAIAAILAFLRREGPQPATDNLLGAIPGALEGAGETTPAGGGLLGGFGGGLMALAGELGALGLGMGEMQAIGQSLFAHMRERAGEESLGEVVGAIPGLGQFV